jgi:integrase
MVHDFGVRVEWTSRHTRRAQTEMTDSKTVAMPPRRMGRGELTVHGLRSICRDWAGETTAHPRSVVEAALAHRVGNKVEHAYARGDRFTKRHRRMENWPEHCGKPVAAHAGAVQDMPTARAAQ